MSAKKAKYIKKTVKFGSNELELFSLDGLTWSSRKDELHDIIERHEANRITFGEIKSGTVDSTKRKELAAKKAEARKAANKGTKRQITEPIPVLDKKKEPVAEKKAAEKKVAKKKTTPKKAALKKTTAKKATAKKKTESKTKTTAKKKTAAKKKTTAKKKATAVAPKKRSTSKAKSKTKTKTKSKKRA